MVFALAAPASAVSHSLVVTNGGGKSLTVCKHWPLAVNTSRSASSCQGGVGVLYRGENSKTKFGWVDADVAYIPRGYSLREPTFGTDHTVYGCRDYSFYAKISPTLWDHTRTFYLWDCPKF